MNDENMNSTTSPDGEDREQRSVDNTIADNNASCEQNAGNNTIYPPEQVQQPYYQPAPQYYPVNNIPDSQKSPYVYHWDVNREINNNENRKNKKRSDGRTFTIITTSAFGIALIVLMLVIIFLPPRDVQDNNYNFSVQELSEKCCPYTVAIEINAVRIQGNKKTTISGVGTGFIVDAKGYIITNYHVIDDVYEYDGTINVYTSDYSRYPADIIGFDENIDIAVLQIKPSESHPLTVAKLASSSAVKTGDSVIAIGTPESISYAGTVTVGHVSCARRVGTSNIALIQFDAAVNPGNSGGPLINADGEVIGVVQMRLNDMNSGKVYDSNGNEIGYAEVASGADGIGLAIPSDDVITLYKKIMSKAN